MNCGRFEIERDVERALSGPAGPATGSTILVGVSGGVDSMVLLHAAARSGARLGLEIRAVHAHHGLRGAAADLDQQLVESTCRDWALPCTSGRLRVGPRGSPEDRARRARRRFLAAAAIRHHAPVILLGHHADDQAETVLDRVLTGAGPDGLRGIRARAPLPEAGSHQVFLLRPLLGRTRTEIRRYADARGVPFREDASNADPAFRRNRLRHEILPFLRESGYPGAIPALGRLAALAGEAAHVIEAATESALEGIARPLEGALRTLFLPLPESVVVLDRPAFRSLAGPLHAPVIRAAIRRLDPDRPPLPGHLALTGLVRRVLRSGGDAAPWLCRRRLWCVQDGARLILSTETLRLARPPYPAAHLDRDEPCRIAGGALRLSLGGPASWSPEFSGSPESPGYTELTGTPGSRSNPGAESCAWLDGDRVTFPLMVRAVLPNDRLETPDRTRAIHLLKRRGVTALERRLVPIVFAADTPRVVAIPGHYTAPWASAGPQLPGRIGLRLHTERASS